MKILTRYILKAHIGPFVFGLAVITFVLILDFINDIFDLVLGKGLSLFIVLEVFALNLAWMLALSIPMAVLVATIMAFGRFAADNEITAIKASGGSLLSLIRPVLVCCLGLTLFLIWFNDRLLPESNYRAKNLMSAIHRKRPTLSLKEGVFMNDFPGYSILVDRIDARSSELEGITIYEQKRDQVPLTIRAKRGKLDVSLEQDRCAITLYEGEMHEVDNGDPSKYRRMTFDTYVLSIDDISSELQLTHSQNRGDREMGIAMMKAKIQDFRNIVTEHRRQLRQIADAELGEDLADAMRSSLSEDLSVIPKETMDRLYTEKRDAVRKLQTEAQVIGNALRQISKYEVEIHKKISIPVACLVFVLIGTSVGVMTRRGGWPLALGISFLFFVLYWAFLIGGEQLADRRMVSAAWAMWSPNIVMGAFGIILLRRAVYETPLFWKKRSPTLQTGVDS